MNGRFGCDSSLRPFSYTFSCSNCFGSIAIYSSVLGNPIGGTRMGRTGSGLSYDSQFAAQRDVEGLSEAMTYKMGLLDEVGCFGGGKGAFQVRQFCSRERALEEYVDELSRLNRLLGEDFFMTGEDIGISEADADRMRSLVDDPRWIVGSSYGSGDPSSATAGGVYDSLVVCSEEITGRGGVSSLDGVSVALQGVGKVGFHLLEKLISSGAKVTVADLDASSLSRARDSFGKEKNFYVCDDPQKLFFCDEYDILAPCAVGGTITREVFENASFNAVCGSANNQLAEADLERDLFDATVLYAPDFLVNAAGAIQVGVEALSNKGVDTTGMFDREVSRIPVRLRKVFDDSFKNGKDTVSVCREIVDEKIARARLG